MKRESSARCVRGWIGWMNVIGGFSKRSKGGKLKKQHQARDTCENEGKNLREFSKWKIKIPRKCVGTKATTEREADDSVRSYSEGVLITWKFAPCAWFGEFSFFQLLCCGIIFQRNFLRFLPPLWDEWKERGKKRGWWKNDFKMAAAVAEKAENFEMRDEMSKNSVLVTQRSLMISHNNITKHRTLSSDHLLVRWGRALRKATSHAKGAENDRFKKTFFSSNRFSVSSQLILLTTGRK